MSRRKDSYGDLINLQSHQRDSYSDLVSLHSQILNQIQFLNSQNIKHLTIFSPVITIFSAVLIYFSQKSDIQISTGLYLFLNFFAVLFLCGISFGGSLLTFNNWLSVLHETNILVRIRAQIPYFYSNELKIPNAYWGFVMPFSRKEIKERMIKVSRFYIAVFYCLISIFAITYLGISLAEYFEQDWILYSSFPVSIICVILIYCFSWGRGIRTFRKPSREEKVLLKAWKEKQKKFKNIFKETYNLIFQINSWENLEIVEELYKEISRLQSISSEFFAKKIRNDYYRFGRDNKLEKQFVDLMKIIKDKQSEIKNKFGLNNADKESKNTS